MSSTDAIQRATGPDLQVEIPKTRRCRQLQMASATADDRGQGALHPLQEANGIKPDLVTYNTLMDFFLDNDNKLMDGCVLTDDNLFNQI
jgi:hypothetical protein